MDFTLLCLCDRELSSSILALALGIFRVESLTYGNLPATSAFDYASRYRSAPAEEAEEQVQMVAVESLECCKAWLLFCLDDRTTFVDQGSHSGGARPKASG